MLETRKPTGLSLTLDGSAANNSSNGIPRNLNAEKHESKDGARYRNPRKGAGNGRKTKAMGMQIQSLFTTPDRHPCDAIEWELRKAVIKTDKGEVVFEADDIEVPKSWSMLATNVVASKYFYGTHATTVREKSVRQLVHRVARTIADWGHADGYFATPADAEVFYKELTHICVNQYAAFNSPVWFNVGLHQAYGVSSNHRSAYYWNAEHSRIEKAEDAYQHPQASACFIQSVADNMEDIMRLASAEAMLFKYGSGTGTDLSTLRSSREKLSGGGTPSGPLSFMRVFDQVAAVIKSGGKTRRAAKMQSLKVQHPDIMDFINCKVAEEKKARVLIQSGYDGSFNGDAYSSVMFQNANLSVRVTDDFLNAVQAGRLAHPRHHHGRHRGSAGRRGRSCAASRKRRISAAIPGCNTTLRSTAGTPVLTAARSTPAIPVRNTCSWTTAPATCLRSPDEIFRRAPAGSTSGNSSTWRAS